MKVKNMISSRGHKIANQFIITGEHNRQQGLFFQSYDSVIAFKPSSGTSVTLDKKYYKYSNTTIKYRNQFLNTTSKEVAENIKSGSYIVADLSG